LSEFLTLATIVRSRGLRGELVADFYSDFPERFEILDELRLDKPGFSTSLELESFWFQKGRIILKFKGIDNPEDSAPLIGCEVRIPEEDRFSLPEGHFYESDLIGCRVVEKGEFLGTVKEVFRAGGDVSNLVVRDEAGKEFMIPFVSRYCLSVDMEAGQIEVDLPPGMVDLASLN